MHTEIDQPAADDQLEADAQAEAGTPPARDRRRARSPLPWRSRPPERSQRGRTEVRDIREGQRMPAALYRDALLRRSLALADLAAGVFALTLAISVEGRAPRIAVLCAPPLVVLFAKLGRLYDRDEHVIHKSTLDQAPALFQVGTLVAMIVWLASGAFVVGGLGRLAIAVMWGALFVGFVTFRFIARRLVARVTMPERVLVLGNAEAARRLRARLATAHTLSATLVGRVALERGDRAEPTPLGPLTDLDYVIRREAIERVVIAPDETPSDDMLDTIRLVKALGVKVSLLPRLFEVVGSSLEIDDIDGITVLGLRRYGLPKTSWYLKRTFDLAVGGFGLLALAPLLSAIAVAIRLTSPGPVFFRQARVGRRGACFEMFKFRTMYEGADEQKARLSEHNQAVGLFKIVDDPRVTPVGRFLRRTSLDELPQLINVIRGEMSLVGPRPLVEEEDRKIAGWHHRRREGTPGMTGLWQVLGPTRVSLDDMVKLDYLYRANWSLWLDMKILLRTVVHVLSQRGL